MRSKKKNRTRNQRIKMAKQESASTNSELQEICNGEKKTKK